MNWIPRDNSEKSIGPSLALTHKHWVLRWALYSKSIEVDNSIILNNDYWGRVNKKFRSYDWSCIDRHLFSGVVTFGVFHGLIFLPVILSWLGPEEQKIPHCKVSLPLKHDDVLFSSLNTKNDVVHENTENQPLQENHHGKMDD
uniref:Uncharacterized protein n=1 Tax=Timema shepardi TaxID=629360 RepID=A0A7R9B5B4_TIMSH|nr:unnamed protein product [Timema shepardi]